MDTIDPKELGRRIRELRVEKKKSQAELGRHLERTHAAVSDIELGKTNLTVQDLQKIAVFFGVTLNDIMAGPPKPVRSAEYYRFAKDASPEDERAANQSIVDFKRLAKEQYGDKQG